MSRDSLHNLAVITVVALVLWLTGSPLALLLLMLLHWPGGISRLS